LLVPRRAERAIGPTIGYPVNNGAEESVASQTAFVGKALVDIAAINRLAVGALSDAH
jgi:hypothetical protein